MASPKDKLLSQGIINILPLPHIVLKKVESSQPISVYSLAKQLEIAYTTASRICRELEFVGLIKSRMEIGENNRAVKILFIKKEETHD